MVAMRKTLVHAAPRVGEKQLLRRLLAERPRSPRSGVDECSSLHESTEDYGAKRSEQDPTAGIDRQGNALHAPRQ